MSQCIVFCRTNLDCTNLEDFLSTFNGGQKFGGKKETGKENKYSCSVMAGNTYACALCICFVSKVLYAYICLRYVRA